MSVSHDQLLHKTADTLDLLLRSDPNTQPSKQKAALVQSVNDLKQEIARARESATGLPGGEQLIVDQDEVIAMLEQLKERKRAILRQFSYDIAQQPAGDDASAQMEIDSMASTPAA